MMPKQTRQAKRTPAGCIKFSDVQYIGTSSMQNFQKEKGKLIIMRSRSPQNIDYGHCTLLFSRGRPRNVPKFETHVQS